MVVAMGNRRLMTTVMTKMKDNSRGRKEEENTMIEGQKSRRGQQHEGQQRQAKQHNDQHGSWERGWMVMARSEKGCASVGRGGARK